MRQVGPINRGNDFLYMAYTISNKAFPSMRRMKDPLKRNFITVSDKFFKRDELRIRLSRDIENNPTWYTLLF